MKKHFAIAVVIFPPDDIMEKCISLNERSYRQGHFPLILSKKEYKPHISLLMGIMKRTDERKIIESIQRVLKGTTAIPLTIAGMNGPWVTLDKTQELQRLHEKLMYVVDPLLEKIPFKPQLFHGKYSLDDIPEAVAPWITDFRSHSFEQYEPHITVGKVKQGKIAQQTFLANRFALCHLSNYNTCKRVLWERSKPTYE